MDEKRIVDKILSGVPVNEALGNEAPGNETSSVYDKKWEKDVWDAAKSLFGAEKKLWDLMAFAPDKYDPDTLQDALNAFNKWYHYFFSVKG